MPGETKQQILDAAERLIYTRGLARVTTKEIARETGLSEGALYRHFNHKEDIFLDLLKKNLPTFIDALATHLAGTGTIQGNLTAIALASIHYYKQVTPLGASFFADTELLARLREIFGQNGGGPHRLFERLAPYIEQEQQLGRITRQRPALSIVSLLLGPCFHYAFTQQLLGTDPWHSTEDRFVEDLVQTLLPALLPPHLE